MSSLISEEDVNEVMARKSSFDRFGDDLTELIVSYLPIEEKFRFECLSKQIQSLIFNKQKKLSLITRSKWLNIESETQKQSLEFRVKYQNLSICLKKLKNLTDIIVEEKTLEKKKSWKFALNSVLKTIADNCHHLIRLDISWYRTKYSDGIGFLRPKLQLFGRKCGKNLKYLTFNGKSVNNYIRHLLPLTPNLISLQMTELKAIHLINANNDKVLPKLKEIEFVVTTCEDLSKVIDIYGNQLKALKCDRYYCNSITLIHVLVRLTACQNLQVLQLRLNNERPFTDKELVEVRKAFKQMADNCHKLRQLEIDFNGFHNERPFLSDFTQLESLVVYSGSDENSILLTDLTQLYQLRRLDIHSASLADNHFANIGQYFPCLEILKVSSDQQLSDKSLEDIPQLKHLKCLSISFNNYHFDDNLITPSGVKQLLDNCNHLTRLEFEYYLNVDKSEQIIELFKQKAKQMPKIDFYFDFGSDDYDSYSAKWTDNKYVHDNLSVRVLNVGFY